MRLRLHGTPAEVAAALPLLAACFEVVDQSRPYPDRPPSRLVRVYLDLRLPALPAPPATRWPATATRRPPMRSPVPWIGLAAIAAMFLLPWLDARGLFDGPRIVRRRPRRGVCADCAQPWTPGHQCVGWLEAAVREPVVPLHPAAAAPDRQVESPAWSGRLVAAEAPVVSALPAAGRARSAPVARRTASGACPVRDRVGGHRGRLCFLFSLGNVYQLAVDSGAVGLDPAPGRSGVDLSLVALVVGIRFLARRGVSGTELRRPRLFMLAVGLAAWALNTAQAVAERDWGKAAFDSLAPGLLIGWAEVLPWFLRQFQAVTHPAADPRPTDSGSRPRHRPAPTIGGPGRRLGPGRSRRSRSRRSAPVAVPAVAAPAGGNGHRPRRPPTAGGEERAADARMRAHWAAERAAGRTPSGAELDRVCGRDPRNGAGRKAPARYLREEAAGRFHAPQPVPVPARGSAAAVPGPVPPPHRPGPAATTNGPGARRRTGRDRRQG